MRTADFSDLDLNIGRARIGLSAVALLSIYVDPTIGGFFNIAPRMMAVMASHFAYSIVIYVVLALRIAAGRLPSIWTVLDILFATALALFAEGPTSPSYAFFAFAIIAAGCRFDFRTTTNVTVSSVLVYLMTLMAVHGVAKNPYLMRPAYLAITGYLIAFLCQQRANFEARIRELESSAERERIARSLHDGYVQALASFSLRLAACQELLSKHRETETLTQLTELRLGVAREYDEVRSYLRTLVNLDQQAGRNSPFGDFDTRFQVEMSFASSGMVVEHVFQVVLEGIRNAWRHGKARSAGVNVRQTAGAIRIAIDDDGTGFGDGASVPWAIASRVSEFGGNLTIKDGSQPGAHIEIEMPAR
jgi:signal transduction histidine kinase